MLSANTESFILPFQLGCLLFLFLVWLLWLNAGEGSGHPCLFHDFRGKTFSFSSLSMMLGVSLLYKFFIYVEICTLYQLWWEFSSWIYVIFQMLFSESWVYWGDHTIFILPFVNEMCHISWFVYFLVTLGWIQVDHGV